MHRAGGALRRAGVGEGTGSDVRKEMTRGAPGSQALDEEVEKALEGLEGRAPGPNMLHRESRPPGLQPEAFHPQSQKTVSPAYLSGRPHREAKVSFRLPKHCPARRRSHWGKCWTIPRTFQSSVTCPWHLMRLGISSPV